MNDIARKAIIGELQNITLDFGKPSAGEIYYVKVSIQEPNGTINDRYINYRFYAPITEEQE